MRLSWPIAIGTAFGLGGLAASYAWWPPPPAPVAAGPQKPAWTEVQWPFLVDEWGKGKAFRCSPADCGREVALYVRAKIGFCNCRTGVADDEELERLTDFNLIGPHRSATGAGKPIAVAWMNGRSRAYALSGSGRSNGTALSIAFNDRCDAIVATAVLGDDQPAMIEPDVIAFLNSETILRWAERTLGL